MAQVVGPDFKQKKRNKNLKSMLSLRLVLLLSIMNKLSFVVLGVDPGSQE
jgi:hypothetical protein